ILHNRFRNCCRLVSSAQDTMLLYGANTVYAGIPVVPNAFDTRNKGIGEVILVSQQHEYVFIDADPTSPTFNEIQNIPAKFATAQPTSGYYPRGWFVANRARVAVAHAAVFGWLRITAGSAHADGVDWVPVS